MMNGIQAHIRPRSTIESMATATTHAPKTVQTLDHRTLRTG